MWPETAEPSKNPTGGKPHRLRELLFPPSPICVFSESVRIPRGSWKLSSTPKRLANAFETVSEELTAEHLYLSPTTHPAHAALYTYIGGEGKSEGHRSISVSGQPDSVSNKHSSAGRAGTRLRFGGFPPQTARPDSMERR